MVDVGRVLRCNASFGDILLTGEQLRILMHTEAGSLVRDHRLMFRLHACSFLASEAVDWLVRVGQSPDRDTGVQLMNLLVHKDIVHHVFDTQFFADSSSLFRFRQDDGTYPWFDDLAIFLQGQQRYNRCASIRRAGDGNTVRGDELVTWMVQNGEAGSREDAVREAQHMLDSHIIRHPTDGQNFRDEPMLYRFPMDFGRKRTLLDLIVPADELSVPAVSSEMTTAQDIPLCRDVNRAESGYHSDNVEACCSSSSQGTSPLAAEECKQSTRGNGTIIRKATIRELEYPNSPFKKQRVMIASDAVGFGFVMRGEGPVFVKTVDPNGPAAASGLKVGHFIYSVNSENVLNMNHRDLAHIILDTANDRSLYVTLVVMEHENDILSS